MFQGKERAALMSKAAGVFRARKGHCLCSCGGAHLRHGREEVVLDLVVEEAHPPVHPPVEPKR